jgi:trimeric autotransporter adhesin
MRLGVDLSILNQKGTPAFYSDIFANRPAFGFAGRVFISTDTGAIYEDTGTAWVLIADAGAGTTGTLQQVTTNGNTTTQGLVVTSGNVAIGTATAGAPLDIHSTGTNAQFNGTGTNNAYVFFQNAGTSKWRLGNFYNAGANSFDIHDTTNATTRISVRNTGEVLITGYNTISNTPTFSSSGNYASNPSLNLTVPASSTFNSGASYSGMAASLLNSFDGSSTIGSGAVMAGFVGVNRQSFNAAGYTITLTQGASGIRAVCGMQVLQQTGGSFTGTITHGASLLVQGVYPTNATNITYTNYYGLLINQLDEYGGVTFTNRWGIYQGGASDKNYFAGNVGIGITSPTAYLMVKGDGNVLNQLRLAHTTNGVLDINITDTVANIIANYITTAIPMAFYTGASERMRLTNTGNVGIGTTTIGSKFQVNGNAAIGFSSSTAGPTNGLTVAGSIGVGNTTVSAWGSGFEALQKGFGAFYGNGTNNLNIGYNGYYNGSGFLYMGNGYAALYQQNGLSTGGHLFYVAPNNVSGAGAALTFTAAMFISSSANVNIGTTTDAASAILQASSTTKGFLPPVMTTTQKNAISSPAAGLVVFDTTLAKLCVYASGAWQTITSV